MKLDILHASTIFGASGSEPASPRICMRVCPAPFEDAMVIDNEHSFQRHNFGDSKRVEATLSISGQSNLEEYARMHIEPDLIMKDGLAGYARADFPTDQDPNAFLEFTLFSTDAHIEKLMAQLENMQPGGASVELWINGFEATVFPEDVWPKPNDRSWTLLPIRSYSFEFEKCSTTRKAIDKAENKGMYTTQLDSDDPETVKMALEWIKDESSLNPDPILKILKDVRYLLFFTLFFLFVILIIAASEFKS